MRSMGFRYIISNVSIYGSVELRCIQVLNVDISHECFHTSKDGVSIYRIERFDIPYRTFRYTHVLNFWWIVLKVSIYGRMEFRYITSNAYIASRTFRYIQVSNFDISHWSFRYTRYRRIATGGTPTQRPTTTTHKRRATSLYCKGSKQQFTPLPIGAWYRHMMLAFPGWTWCTTCSSQTSGLASSHTKQQALYPALAVSMQQ